MKTIPSALLDHLGQVSTTLTTIWDITRVDGTVVRLTELDVDLVVGGNTYKAAYGYSRSALASRASLEPDDIDLDGVLNSDYIAEEDVKAGLYNSADLVVSLVNYEAPEDGVMILKRGILGPIFVSPSGRMKAELRSLASKLDQEILEKSTPLCRARVGDSRCTVPMDPDVRANTTAYSVGDFVKVATDGDGSSYAHFENRIYECTAAGVTASSTPTFNTTAGGTTTDGTVTWTARQAWSRHATVSAVTNNRQFEISLTESRAVDDWFNQGEVVFQTGDNANRVFEVKDWSQSSSLVSLFLPAPKGIQVGDTLFIKPGCDLRRTTCRNKWVIAGSNDFANGNVINFRGEPDLPGRDAVLSYPDAQ